MDIAEMALSLHNPMTTGFFSPIHEAGSSVLSNSQTDLTGMDAEFVLDATHPGLTFDVDCAQDQYTVLTEGVDYVLIKGVPIEKAVVSGEQSEVVIELDDKYRIPGNVVTVLSEVVEVVEEIVESKPKRKKKKMKRAPIQPPVESTSSSSPLTSPTETYKTTSAHIPMKSFLIRSFKSFVPCIGCDLLFPCYFTPKGRKKIPCPEFYIHAIDECIPYREMGLIQECDICNFKFLDKESLNIHKISCRTTNKRKILKNKPTWMPDSILMTIINYSKFDSQTECRGCRRKFPCYRKGTKVVPCLEYYIHCVEDCQEYRNRGWLRSCTVCGCKFLNNQALAQHQRKCL